MSEAKSEAPEIKLHVFGVRAATPEQPLTEEQRALVQRLESDPELRAQEAYRQALEAGLRSAIAELRTMANNQVDDMGEPAGAEFDYDRGYAAGVYSASSEAAKLIVNAVRAAEAAVKP